MANKREDELAGKHRDMGIKTIEGQDNEGHIKGSNQSAFNERSTPERRVQEDMSELNEKDARDNVRGTEQI